MDSCTGCCDITEMMLKMKLNTIQSNNHSKEKLTHLDLLLYFIFHYVFVYFHISINNKIKNAVNHDIGGHKNTNK